jgi:microcystin-dependent protein
MVNDQLDKLTLEGNWYAAGVDAETVAELAQSAVWNENICMIGMVSPFALQSPPAGWLLCDGQSVAQADYPELAASIDPSHLSGSDIVLPDLTGRVVVGSDGSTINYNDAAGEREHTLTIEELAAHTHTYEKSVVSDIDLELTGAPQPVYNAPISADTGSTGDGDPHNNMQPYLALNWYIFSGR